MVSTKHHRSLLLGLAALAAIGMGNTPSEAGPPNPIVLAQAGARPGNEARQEDRYLDIVKQLRSQCSSAAWTLWQSNRYEEWRRGKSQIMHMMYSSGSYPSLPSAPANWPEALREKAESAVKRANDSLKDSAEIFKDMANYIKAKDYEDDKFKKGDELNAKLVEHGRTCHRLFVDLSDIYTEAASALIEARKGGAAKPDVVAAMIGDWQKTRPLAQELARFEKADIAKLDGLVKEISALAEDRKANFAALKDNPDSSLKRFYDRILNEDIAVKMRRLLRDAKNPKAFAAAAADRPRSDFWSVRSEIEIGLPDSLLNYIRSAK